jgi:hypothetical protein
MFDCLTIVATVYNHARRGGLAFGDQKIAFSRQIRGRSFVPAPASGRQIMTGFEQFIPEAQDIAISPKGSLWRGLSAERFLANPIEACPCQFIVRRAPLAQLRRAQSKKFADAKVSTQAIDHATTIAVKAINNTRV